MMTRLLFVVVALVNESEVEHVWAAAGMFKVYNRTCSLRN